VEFRKIQGLGALLPHFILAAVCVVCIGYSGHSFGKDADNDEDAAKPTTPTVYLDLRTTYAAVPGGSLAIGFGNTALFNVLETIALANSNARATIPTSVKWPNNWKFTARVGVQSFGGAQLLNRTPILPFTEPILRFDLDRMDDNDNRLFGVTAQVQWIRSLPID